MSLGKKRARPPMKRTASMTEFTLDLINGDGAERVCPPLSTYQKPFNGGAAASPTAHRRNSAGFVETAHFLRVCSLCTRRLIPGHDIYMYRGDSAFCSVDCREHQMTQDERKEKCSLPSKKGVATTAAAAVNHLSAADETVTAAVWIGRETAHVA